MQKKSRCIQVLMPDDSLLEVSYYCIPASMATSVQSATKLIIQLDDCMCSLEIDEAVCNNQNSLERLVHNKVINTKGHLC